MFSPSNIPDFHAVDFFGENWTLKIFAVKREVGAADIEKAALEFANSLDERTHIIEVRRAKAAPGPFIVAYRDR